MALVAILTLAAFPAAAGDRGFQAYEGPDALQTGHGGTKVQNNGVDFWTMGAPARPYRLLGVIIDRRGTGMFNGDPTTSKAFAERVRAAGGDAVIMLDQNTQVTGAVVSESTMALVHKQTSRFLVIHYEPAPAQ